MRRLLLIALVPLLGALVPVGASATSGCGLTSPAFCDTFSAATGGAERSGDLNSAIWGVSRVNQLDNIGQGMSDDWAPATMNACGTIITGVLPGADVRICNGQLDEGLNDNGQTALLAMYPRQPFDFAGRTGTIAFGVTDDSQGGHAAWPAIVITDQPVPGPGAPSWSTPGIDDVARNAIGVSLAQSCTTASGAAGISADDVWTVANYVTNPNVVVNQDGCAAISPGPNSGKFNLVQVKVSATALQVYMSDAGGTTLQLVADAAITAPMTRGVVWMEDVHYNACKFNSQCNHVFDWENFGFDGPVLARDLGVELPDSKIAVGDGTVQLGYVIPATGTVLQKTFTGVSNVAGATAVLLEFTCSPQASGDVFTYAFNGGTAQTATPTMGSFNQETVALPVPLSQLVNGSNVLTISDSNGPIDAANFDLILVGAG